MRAEKRFDPASFLRWLDEMGVTYLLIGGQAVRLYGSNRSTVDYDFWFPPEVRVPILEHLVEAFEMALPAEPSDRRRPIVVAQSDFDKVDLFFVRGLSAPNGRHLDFEDWNSRVHWRANVGRWLTATLGGQTTAGRFVATAGGL